MDAATATPAGTLRARGSVPEGDGRRRRFPVLADVRPRRTWAYPAALAALLVISLLIRLWGIKQGLPYSYNADEATHFVPRAIAFLSQDLNPHYFLNPPAYSYLLYVVFELWFGSADAIRHAYTTDPTAVFVVARVVVAVLGTAAVWLTYLAGARLLDRAIGLLAAAILAFGFLPVFYSHLALNDVPTLAPVALALYGIAGVLRLGRRRDYAIAGVGIGLAAATKYTGGITLVCLLAAFACDAVGGRMATAARRFALAVVLALVAFLVANPYAALDPHAFFTGVNQQASLAAGTEPVKLGSNPGSGIDYYLWTFTWGLGWGPTIAALGGAGLLLVRRRIAMALVLLPAPIAFIVFMGDQQRFFGRWLLPVFPIVAILGAYGAVELARALSRPRPPEARRGRLATLLAAAIVAVLMLGQSVVADLHNDRVLSRPDTRNLVRAWMVAHVPAGAKVVIEPLVPDNWALDIGRSLPVTPTGERWWRYPTWLTSLDPQGNPLPPGERRYVFVDQYERYLYPALLDQYVQAGYCWVVIGSLQAGRAFAQPQAAPTAIAYYAELARRATLAYQVSPFANGSHPVKFSFDWSIDYYPRQYRRPGPEVGIYHLSGGRCTAATVRKTA
jgi:Dolichyl-phosphate-mannose-protein mannosyltransferase